MQAKYYFGTGMWSGADVCPALEGDFNTSRALMEEFNSATRALGNHQLTDCSDPVIGRLPIMLR